VQGEREEKLVADFDMANLHITPCVISLIVIGIIRCMNIKTSQMKMFVICQSDDTSDENTDVLLAC
jgi:hypothetical protein